MITAVLFDLWDTLAYLPGIAEVIAAMRTALGPERSEALRPIMVEYQRNALTTDDVIARFRALGPLGDEEERLMRVRLDYLDCALYDETLPVLKELRERGLKIGLISNAPLSTGGQLQTLGLVSLFDTICLSYESHLIKPEPAFFLLAAEKLEMPPQNILMVGDSVPWDIEGANGVGMPSVRIDRAAPAPTQGVITDLRQLLELV